uniref:Endonuclease/exonuclease/phosphatase domain-containing protein n=1 Tax=Nothobranchius furzeri TaxID=105023 RepID=A0A1A8A119_NOTFU
MLTLVIPVAMAEAEVATIHREKWRVLPVSVPDFSSFECMVFKLPIPTPTTVASVYRPPKPNSDFINDLSLLLTQLSTLSQNVILLGDFNKHSDNKHLPMTREFLSCLESFGLSQFVDVPTHIKGHTLDSVCCSGVIPTNCAADELPLTDHFLLSFNVTLCLSAIHSPHLISFRNLKSIDMDTLSTNSDNIKIPDHLSRPD